MKYFFVASLFRHNIPYILYYINISDYASEKNSNIKKFRAAFFGGDPELLKEKGISSRSRNHRNRYRCYRNRIHCRIRYRSSRIRL